MSDSYLNFSHSKFGKQLFSIFGLSIPPQLTRHIQGDLLVKNSIVVSNERNLTLFKTCFPDNELSVSNDLNHIASGLIFDGSHIKTPDELTQCYDFFNQKLQQLPNNSRILIIGLVIIQEMPILQACAQRALSGVVKSLAKEVGRKGCTVNLLSVSSLSVASLAASSRFFISDKSAFITGQSINSNGTQGTIQSWDKPLTGKTALVTGASRGIGAAIAKCLAQDGAHIIGLDIPQAKEKLDEQMRLIGGESLLLNITDDQAAQKIIDSLAKPLDIIVHNAGITRDKTLKRMSIEQWQLVIDINLTAVANINTTLIDNNQLSEDGRIVCVSSISGIAGNAGQVNYAASKAGIIGLVEATASYLAANDRNITINGVAPGFIETEMTASIPLMIRHFGRRMSSFSQGGLPSDVAHAISFLASPNAKTINGNVLRVCGQNLLGT